MKLEEYIRDVPDFPKKGIIFKDITTLLKDTAAFKEALDVLCERYKDKGIEKIVAIESRGFIFGGAMAHKLGAGFVPVRKKGKLPAETLQATYELEYGTDTLEIHKDAISAGEKVLLIDDLLATGGTASAVAGMLKDMGADIIDIAFLIELTFLNGRSKLKSLPVFAMIKY